MSSLLFAGAAGEVTGSRHLLSVFGKKILLDCGMFQGHRQDADKKNRRFLFEPASVDALILSHAHLDHCGAIPRLIRDGFRGRIFCTAATADLAMLILEDSARIQQQDFLFYNKKNPGKAMEPLYSEEDVERCRDRFSIQPYGLAFEPIPGVKAWLHEAGHILGSAQVSLQWAEGGQPRRLLFSGDLGREGMPLIRDPWSPAQPGGILLMESTYGNREHSNLEGAEQRLADLVNATAARGGKVIIPAFAVGRAQELIYELALLRQSGKTKPLKVFVDSPMASRATRIFEGHRGILDADFHEAARGFDPFVQDWIRHTESVEESKSLNGFMGPCIIISASGMCESGRILHHLRNHLDDPRTQVLIVGYQAEGTLGRRLVEKQPEVLIYGLPVKVRAQVKSLNEYSAHADKNDLLKLATQARPERCFLVHGESQAQADFARTLREKLGLSAETPFLGDEVELFTP